MFHISRDNLLIRKKLRQALIEYRYFKSKYKYILMIEYYVNRNLLIGIVKFFVLLKIWHSVFFPRYHY